MKTLHPLLRGAAAGALVLLLALLALAAAPPAGFAGTWKGAINGPQGDIGFQLNLTQHDGAWQGSITVNDRTIPVQQLKVDGNQISFDTSFGQATIHHTGTLNGDSLSLQISSDQFNTSVQLQRQAVAAAAAGSDASAAPAASLPPPVKLTSGQDRQRMLDLLQITSLRPGVDPNHPDSPNPVNYDEAKANPYPHLPNPLVMNDGTPVTSAAMWWNQRRPQIVEAFDDDVYGRVPQNTPAVHWEVTSVIHGMNGSVPVITKSLVGHVDNSSYPLVNVEIQLMLTTPANASGPVPVMMQFGFDPAFMKQFMARMAARGIKMPPRPAGPTWQQQVLARGWGYAVLVATSIQPDNGAGLTQGIIGLCNHGQPRQPDDWGALRAWAWGASRALDYFETDKSVDAKHVGLEGHSRYGKATLVAMAYDQRFAIAYVSSSGKGGAAPYRRNFGEGVGNVDGANEYHWMAGNFLKYDGPLSINDLPVDTNELIAMCAPRPVFISGGATKGDGWVDAHGMFIAAAGASPVYELLGKKGLGTTVFPPIMTPLLDGDVAFRQHDQGHTDVPNWPYFLKFASRYIKSVPSTPAAAPAR